MSFKTVIDRYQSRLESTFVPIYAFGNHDQSRIVSRFGTAQARTLAMLSLTLPGVPLIYNGDEIGMHDVDIPPDRIRDPNGMLEKGSKGGRDPERTPLQWNKGQHAGFTHDHAQPWLPIADDYQTNNIASQMNDPLSMLSLYRNLISMRKNNTSMQGESYRPLEGLHRKVFGYIRGEEGEEQFAVVLNFSNRKIKVRSDVLHGAVNLSTDAQRQFLLSRAR